MADETPRKARPGADVFRDDTSKSFIHVLKQIEVGAGEEGLAVAAIVDRLDERAFGLMVLLLAIPCLVPGLPGAQILAVPIFLLACQIVVGRREPWLPGWFMRTQVRKGWIGPVSEFADKRLRWTERLARPRLKMFASGLGERGVAVLMALAALTIMLPITNTIPSLAIALMAIGLIQRDGLFAVAGASIAAAWFTLLVLLGAGLIFGAAFAVDIVNEGAPWLMELLGG